MIFGVSIQLAAREERTARGKEVFPAVGQDAAEGFEGAVALEAGFDFERSAEFHVAGTRGRATHEVFLHTHATLRGRRLPAFFQMVQLKLKGVLSENVSASCF